MCWAGCRAASSCSCWARGRGRAPGGGRAAHGAGPARPPGQPPRRAARGCTPARRPGSSCGCATTAPATTPVLRLRDAVTGTRGANGAGQPAAIGRLRAGRLPAAHRPAGDAARRPARRRRGRPLRADRRRGGGGRASPSWSSTPASIRSWRSPWPRATTRRPPPATPTPWAAPATTSTRCGPYQVGDDLRRVHWPATAHHDELMIRQHELPWQERTTVLLDVRARPTSGESFELAVSAAASVLNACSGRGDQVRLITTAGTDSGFEGGRGPPGGLLPPPGHRRTSTRPPSLQRSLDLLGADLGGGSLVLVVATLATTDLRRLARTWSAASPRSSPCSSSPRRGIRTASTRPRRPT